MNNRITKYDVVSLPDLLSKAPPLSDDARFLWYFRGQKLKNGWTLTPSVYRDHYDTALTISSTRWIEYEESLLRSFKREAVPYLTFVPRSDLEWLMVGQHHGLPTRLLDFTTSLLIALFFALEQEGEEARVVWALEVLTFGMPKRDDIPFADLFKELPGATVILPTHVTPRITAQKAVFVMAPTPERRPYVPLEKRGGAAMVKYRIPALHREGILGELKRAGIDYQTIYPDLAGVVLNIKSRIGKVDPNNASIGTEATNTTSAEEPNAT